MFVKCSRHSQVHGVSIKVANGLPHSQVQGMQRADAGPHFQNWHAHFGYWFVRSMNGLVEELGEWLANGTEISHCSIKDMRYHCKA
jgi:hypothetical protein